MKIYKDRFERSGLFLFQINRNIFIESRLKIKMYCYCDTHLIL